MNQNNSVVSETIDESVRAQGNYYKFRMVPQSNRSVHNMPRTSSMRNLHSACILRQQKNYGCRCRLCLAHRIAIVRKRASRLTRLLTTSFHEIPTPFDLRENKP